VRERVGRGRAGCGVWVSGGSSGVVVVGVEGVVGGWGGGGGGGGGERDSRYAILYN